MGIKLIFTAISVYGLLCPLAEAEPAGDKRALLEFVSNLSRNLKWDEKASACSQWTGVTCDPEKSRIIALRLPAVGFNGGVSFKPLGRLSALEILCLKSNGIRGPFPRELVNLSRLTELDLQYNSFYGPLPLDFIAWKNLSVLHLSNNAFNGSIPYSISYLTRLTSLDLSSNLFSGYVPDLDMPGLGVLNLSNNSLTGGIPGSLSKFPMSCFSSNNMNISISNHPRKKPSSRLGESAVLGIAIGSVCVVFLAVVLLLFFISHKKKEGDVMLTASEKKDKSSDYEGVNGKITFFEGCNILAFDLEDLLRASAEVLGKGSFGTTYKAALEDATTVVVKRLKEVAVGKREFGHHMEVVGGVRHENVAPLRAYYYSKDEKLVVYDYYHWGSVSSLLHGKRGEKPSPLDWEARLKIVAGAARGLAHIHSQCHGKLVHGNVKSHNIFLNHSNHLGCVADVGLPAVMCPAASLGRGSGYRAPEVSDSRRATQQSDVYAFGVVLLELLTGKSAVCSAGGGSDVIHLERWVNSVVREEWTGEVFDVELLRYPNIEEEMVGLLQIGLSCVVRMPNQRPRMDEVVRMVEDVRRFNGGRRPPAPAKARTLNTP